MNLFLISVKAAIFSIMESYVLEISSVFTISYSLFKEISYDSIHFPGGLNTTEELQIEENKYK